MGATAAQAPSMTPRGAALLLLLPAGIALVALLVLPLFVVVDESFRLFEPGRIGSAKDAPYTLQNYHDVLISPIYLKYFYDTLKFSLIASLLSVVLGFPIAYLAARQRSPVLRKAIIGFLVAMLFLSVLVRMYALQLTFGPAGFQRIAAALLDMSPNSRPFIETLVVLGLLHYTLPMSALILIGIIQNVNPSLVEAAQVLGASRTAAHATITIPLCLRGIATAFLLSYTLSISTFIIPLVLGRGRVLFVSNLIYSRFSDVADYPGGAAISIVILCVSLFLVHLVSTVAPQARARPI
jgi:ABC-type spermidine/putrescine transport system permease subunit I